MRVLLDECCPSPLASCLKDAEVYTVERAGLKGVKNGALVMAAEGAFSVVITADKNLRYQQDLRARKIAIVELPFNSWKRLRTLVPVIQAAIASIKPGQYLEIPSSPGE